MFKNKPFIITLCIAVALAAILLVSQIGGSIRYPGDAVPDKEAAIAVGRALLDGYLEPDTEATLDAEERRGVWRVYNVVEDRTREENGRILFSMGGVSYVEFRKSDGKVLKFGVND
jgi:hypothetical protein